MATIPAVTQPTVGQAATAAWADSVGQAATFLTTPPSLYTYQNTAQAALTTAVSTLITFDTNVYDTDTAGSTHSTVTNTSRVLPLTAGYHQVIATVTFTSNATGFRQVDLRKNAAGSSVGGTRVGLCAEAAANGTVTVVQLSAIVQFNGTTDYVEVFADQTSGGGLAVYANTTSGGWQSATSIQTRWLNS